jgi:hypothetical protein
MDAILKRSAKNLERLEDIARTQCDSQRSGAALGGEAPDGVGAAGGDTAVWRSVLAHVQRVRDNLKPVELAHAGAEGEGDPSAWVRSLRSRLKKTSAGGSKGRPTLRRQLTGFSDTLSDGSLGLRSDS